MTSRREAVLDAVKVMCFGLIFVNLATWALWMPDLSLAFPVPFATNGLGLIYVGMVLLLLPPRLHFSKVHTRINLAGIGVFAIAFAAFAVYAFWPSAR